MRVVQQAHRRGYNLLLLLRARHGIPFLGIESEKVKLKDAQGRV